MPMVVIDAADDPDDDAWNHRDGDAIALCPRVATARSPGGRRQ
jgi:hypothetical protein